MKRATLRQSLRSKLGYYIVEQLESERPYSIIKVYTSPNGKYLRSCVWTRHGWGPNAGMTYCLQIAIRYKTRKSAEARLERIKYMETMQALSNIGE
jgi:hypothetical protein